MCGKKKEERRNRRTDPNTINPLWGRGFKNRFFIQVINTETGKEVGANEKGEICLKGVTVMLGYWHKPEATKQSIDEQGWLHTGT